MILDYSSHIGDSHAVTPGSHKTEKKDKMFYEGLGWCPFCKTNATVVHFKRTHPDGNNSSDFYNKIWACASCGWY